MSHPPTSPRLPSPPPAPEIQHSPLMSGANSNRQAQQIEVMAMDANSKRRIHRGSRSVDMAAGPPLVPLNELDSPFQLQEHLAALHYHHTAQKTSPMTRETSRILATSPPAVDRTLWLYELCRLLINKCNDLITGFFADSPPCSAVTCPEMRASEWQFLCAVHDQPKSCCAIDYCCHTLDWASDVVTNPKIFPSRFVVDANERGTAAKNLINVFRRLHRIFAHAWFQHRGVFWSVEGQTGLYVFFKTVCDVYELLPAENYKLPPEAEGLDSGAENVTEHSDERRQHLATRPTCIFLPQRSASGGAASDYEPAGGEEATHAVGRTNTRRQIRSSPSTGVAVPTVMEAEEDGRHSEGSAGDISRNLRNIHILPRPAQTVEEEHEPEMSDIPVIVDGSAAEGPSTIVPISSSSESSSARQETQAGEPTSSRKPEADTSKQAAALPTAATEFELEPVTHQPSSQPSENVADESAPGSRPETVKITLTEKELSTEDDEDFGEEPILTLTAREDDGRIDVSPAAAASAPAHGEEESEPAVSSLLPTLVSDEETKEKEVPGEAKAPEDAEQAPGGADKPGDTPGDAQGLEKEENVLPFAGV